MTGRRTVLVDRPAALTTAAPRTPPPAHGVRRRLVPFGYLSPTVALLTALMAVPIAMVFYYSFVDRAVTRPAREFVGFANYAEVLGDPAFRTALANTAFFVGASVVAHLVIGMVFALLLDTPLLPHRVKAFFRAVHVLPWLFTVAIVAVLWRLLLSPDGVVNHLLAVAGFIDDNVEWLADPGTALLAVTAVNVWSGYPFFMMSLLAGLQGIPQSLREAAVVDGAGPLQRFVHITLPQLRPIVVSMCVLDVIWTSQQFALVWMTTGGGPIDATELLSTFTYKLAFSEYDFTVASASAVVVLVLSMLVAVLYVRSQRSRD